MDNVQRRSSAGLDHNPPHPRVPITHRTRHCPASDPDRTLRLRDNCCRLRRRVPRLNSHRPACPRDRHQRSRVGWSNRARPGGDRPCTKHQRSNCAHSSNSRLSAPCGNTARSDERIRGLHSRMVACNFPAWRHMWIELYQTNLEISIKDDCYVVHWVCDLVSRTFHCTTLNSELRRLAIAPSLYGLRRLRVQRINELVTCALRSS